MGVIQPANAGEIKKLMKKYSIEAKKNFGQNFLINPSVSEKIASASMNGADDGSNTGVIEIGAGMGALSWELCKLYKKVAAVEVDRTLEPILNEVFEDTYNFKLVPGDILKTDLRELASREFYAEGIEKINVCANLPYYITTPAIEYLLVNSGVKLGTVTLTIQKEAADKLCAEPGDKNYAAVTLLVNYIGKIKKLFNVPPSNFYPSPKITSAVVRIAPHGADKLIPKDEQMLFKIIRAAFEQRRKTLVNALSSVLEEDVVNKSQLTAIVENAAGDANIRGEALSIAEFVDIADMLAGLNVRKTPAARCEP